MKLKLLSFNSTKHHAMLFQLGKLTFLFLLLKGLFWLGLTGWLIYMGSGTG